MHDVRGARGEYGLGVVHLGLLHRGGEVLGGALSGLLGLPRALGAFRDALANRTAADLVLVLVHRDVREAVEGHGASHAVLLQAHLVRVRVRVRARVRFRAGVRVGVRVRLQQAHHNLVRPDELLALGKAEREELPEKL